MGIGDIGFEEGEVRVVGERGEVVARAGVEAVEGDDAVAVPQEARAEVASEEPRAACHQCRLFHFRVLYHIAAERGERGRRWP